MWVMGRGSWVWVEGEGRKCVPWAWVNVVGKKKKYRKKKIAQKVVKIHNTKMSSYTLVPFLFPTVSKAKKRIF